MKAWILFLIPYIIYPASVAAGELDEEFAGTLTMSAPAAVVSSHPTHWTASLLYGFVAYSEPGLMSESGSLGGLALSYAYAFRENPFIVQVEGEYLYGQLTYSGATWEGQPLTVPATDNILNGRILVGYQMPSEGRLTLKPMLGIAARYLNDQIENSYNREITYIYAPIGATFDWRVANHWSMSLYGEYDYFLSGHAVSHLDQTGSGYPAVNNSQTGGYGYRISVGINHDLSFGRTLKISPYLYYWSVRQSDTQTFLANNTTVSVWEPGNTSTMYGVNVSFVF